jgi:hypothetical protein
MDNAAQIRLGVEMSYDAVYKLYKEWQAADVTLYGIEYIGAIEYIVQTYVYSYQRN